MNQNSTKYYTENPVQIIHYIEEKLNFTKASFFSIRFLYLFAYYRCFKSIAATYSKNKFTTPDSDFQRYYSCQTLYTLANIPRITDAVAIGERHQSVRTVGLSMQIKRMGDILFFSAFPCDDGSDSDLIHPLRLKNYFKTSIVIREILEKKFSRIGCVREGFLQFSF